MNLIDLNLFCRGLVEGRRCGELDDETVTVRAGALIEWLLNRNDRLSAKYIMRRFKSCFIKCPSFSHYRDLIAKDEPADSDFHVDMIVVEAQLC